MKSTSIFIAFSLLFLLGCIAVRAPLHHLCIGGVGLFLPISCLCWIVGARRFAAKGFLLTGVFLMGAVAWPMVVTVSHQAARDPRYQTVGAFVALAAVGIVGLLVLLFFLGAIAKVKVAVPKTAALPRPTIRRRAPIMQDTRMMSPTTARHQLLPHQTSTANQGNPGDDLRLLDHEEDLDL